MVRLVTVLIRLIGTATASATMPVRQNWMRSDGRMNISATIAATTRAANPGWKSAPLPSR